MRLWTCGAPFTVCAMPAPAAGVATAALPWPSFASRSRPGPDSVRKVVGLPEALCRSLECDDPVFTNAASEPFGRCCRARCGPRSLSCVPYHPQQSSYRWPALNRPSGLQVARGTRSVRRVIGLLEAIFSLSVARPPPSSKHNCRLCLRHFDIRSECGFSWPCASPSVSLATCVVLVRRTRSHRQRRDHFRSHTRVVLPVCVHPREEDATERGFFWTTRSCDGKVFVRTLILTLSLRRGTPTARIAPS